MISDKGKGTRIGVQRKPGTSFRSSSEVAVMSDSVIPLTAAYQAPPSMEFSRQEYWSGVPFPPQGDLPNPGIEPRSPSLQADALPSEPPGKP